MHLMERLEFDLLWFVGLGIDDAVWDHSTFSKSRDRLLEGEAAVAVGATASEAGVVYTPAQNGAFLNGITPAASDQSVAERRSNGDRNHIIL